MGKLPALFTGDVDYDVVAHSSPRGRGCRALTDEFRKDYQRRHVHLLLSTVARVNPAIPSEEHDFYRTQLTPRL